LKIAQSGSAAVCYSPASKQDRGIRPDRPASAMQPALVWSLLMRYTQRQRLLKTIPMKNSLFRLAVSFLLVAATPVHAQQPAVIRFGVSSAGVGNPPRITTGSVAVAQAKGYLEEEFKKDNIKVEWIFFKGQGPAVNEALTNNQLDFTTLGDLPAIIGRSVGINARVIMLTGRRSNNYVAVKPNAGINSVADLRGKRVGFHKGTATQLAVDRMLSVHGLSEKDIRAVNLEPGTAQAAFESGDLDAIVYTVQLLALRDKGTAKILYTSKEDPAATGAGHILVNEPFAKKYPDITRRVVKALVKSAYWASEERNRENLFKVWAAAGSTTPAMYREDYQGTPLAHRLSPLLDPYIVAGDKRAVEDAYRFKLIRKQFDVNAWFDSSYLDAALRELKLENYWPRLDVQGKVIDNN
jgi:sulfonate transport system substrate-binding protein